MDNLLIRRIIGLSVVIFGVISGILFIACSTKINASLTILLSALPQSAQAANDISSISGTISLIFEGLSFGIIGICLALGAMVFKIGGKEKITLSLKEDGLEAAIAKNEPDFVKQESTHLSLENDQIRNENPHIKKADEINHIPKKTIPKKIIFLLLAILLLIGNIAMLIAVLFKK